MRIRSIFLGSSAVVALAATPLAAQSVNIAPNAPSDRPVPTTMMCQWRAMQKAMEPFVSHARASYPEAKRRYQAGLPTKSSFFVTTRLADSAGRFEQVFVVVDSVGSSGVIGRIWSQINVVTGYRLGQKHSVPDSAIVDWMFSRPDGSEEGNVVGKFLDTYRPPAECREATR